MQGSVLLARDDEPDPRLKESRQSKFKVAPELTQAAPAF